MRAGFMRAGFIMRALGQIMCAEFSMLNCELGTAMWLRNLTFATKNFGGNCVGFSNKRSCLFVLFDIVAAKICPLLFLVYLEQNRVKQVLVSNKTCWPGKMLACSIKESLLPVCKIILFFSVQLFVNYSF